MLSSFTLGTAQLGMQYGIANKLGKLDSIQAFKVLDEAIKHGIKSFDTAAGYGDSEKLLGEYFFKRNLDYDIEIITKLDVLITDPNIKKDLAIKKAENSIKRSLDRLKINNIPVLLFHRYNDLMWQNHIIIDYLKKKDYLKKIGVSVYTPDEALTAMQVNGISVIQIPTNLLDLRFIKKGVFDIAKKKGIQIYIRSIFLQGLILINIDDIPSFLNDGKIYIKQLKKLCNNKMHELTFSFLKSIKGNVNIIIGCECPEQVKENIEILKCSTVMSNEQQKKIFEINSGLSETIINPALWNK